MAIIDNVFKNVVTYNDSALAYLLNSFCFISTSNKKFKDFNTSTPKNLGDTVSFDLPSRFTTTDSLAILAQGSPLDSFQPARQRFLNLTVDQQAATAYEFSAQNFIFNAREYMDKFGRSAVAEIGSRVESNVAGLAESNTFRFYNLLTTQKYGALAQALSVFRSFGAAKDQTKGYLSLDVVPNIINSGLSQFVPVKNDAQMMSWEIGRFSNCDWYSSNLLPIHTSGVVGNAAGAANRMNVVSVNTDPATGGVYQITFNNASGGAGAIKRYDKFQFSPVNVLGDPVVAPKFLTFIGHIPTSLPVQFCALEDATEAGGLVTVRFSSTTANGLTGNPAGFPQLQSVSVQAGVNVGSTRNIDTPIVAGMAVTVLPNHRCGLITSGNPLMLGMPRLPEEVPFPTATAMDPDSGASLRQYYGSLFGQNRRGMIHDVIWGKQLVPEYAMMIALPTNLEIIT